MKSIRKKLFGVFLLFMLMLVAGNVIVNIFFVKEYYMQQTKKRLRKTSEQVEELYQNRRYEIPQYVEMVDSIWGIWVMMIDEKYTIINNSRENSYNKGTLSKRFVKAVKKGIKESDEKELYYTEMTDEKKISRLLLLKKMDDNRYLILSRTIKSVDENIRIANQLVILTALLLLSIGSVFIWYFSNTITRPILDISETAKQIANQNFSVKAKVKSDDEIGVLASSINEISDKLYDNISELKDDIQARKELVRNMSHELKTPISVVKGYAEGLKYAVASSPEKMNKYCDVIINECDKMNMLVKDMLNLSTMESVRQVLCMEEIKPERLLGAVTMSFGKKIDEEGIKLCVNSAKEKSLYGDYALIERALFNYVENAIHHVDENGEIAITIECGVENAAIRVYNSGSMIPEGDLNKIWNVFYKVDKARMRNSNNYGIGLAIVKSIIEMHNGEVFVENTKNGVEFAFTLPNYVKK